MLPNIAAFDTYGGAKQDYAPPEDPTTDRSADEENEALADTSAMTRMSPRAYVAFTTNGTTCTVTDSDAVWGNGTPPTVTRTGAGAYTVTWQTTVTDARGNTQPVNLRRGWGDAEDAGYQLNVAKSAPNVVTVSSTKISTAALTDPPNVMVVFVV